MTAKAMKTTSEIDALVEQIKPLLTGKSPRTQGAVLADLLAMWLAGHHVEGDPDATRKMRTWLLTLHCDVVRRLTVTNAKILGTTP